MITKVTFVGDAFTRKAPKYERFIRPTGLRFNKGAHNPPRTQNDLLPRHSWCEEEPLVGSLHKLGCHYKGHHHRSKRERVGPRDAVGQSGLGQGKELFLLAC